MDFSVRPMHTDDDRRTADIAGIRALCNARSYMGRAISEVFSYTELWADLVVGPYEKFAPDLIWVTEEAGSGEIVGYLTGAMEVDFYAKQSEYLDATVERLRQQSLVDLVSNPFKLWNNALSLIAGLDRRTLQFLNYLNSDAQKEVPQRPASPHFNVFARHDGCGIARALIGRFMSELVTRGISNFHINALFVPDIKERERLQALGFRVRSPEFFTPHYTLYDSLETKIFSPHKVMLGVFESKT